MKQKISPNIIGIDIGTNYLRACIKSDEILDFIKMPVSGIHSGNIINKGEFTNSLLRLSNKIKKNYNFKKIKIVFGVSGTSLNSGDSNISVNITRRDSKVTENEINSLIEKNENIYNAHNLTTLSHYIKKYRLNNVETQTAPIGHRGSRLDARIFSISTATEQVKIIEDACYKLKLEIIDIVASPLIETDLILNNKQRLAGVGVLHIGNTHSSLVVYENYNPVAVGTINFGTQDLDNEIALGLKVSLEEAYDMRQGIKITGYNKRKFEDTLDNVITKWAEKVNHELDFIKRKELLPAGLLIIGNITEISKFELIFKNKMRLPIKLNRQILDSIVDYKIDSTEWIRPLSLAIIDTHTYTYTDKTFSKIYNHIKDILCQFLP